jgi:hypothetical protein
MADETARSEPDEDDWPDRETLLDITVNLIPMGILLFFFALTVVITPWEFDPLIVVLQHFLTLFPFLLLGILTYFSARAVAGTEHHT